VTVSRSFLAPSVSAVGSSSDRSSGYSSAVKQSMPDTRSSSAGLDVAWEVDLSGRLRAGAAAAAADALAAEHGVRGVRLLVMTDVATNYFTLVGALRQLDTLRAISAAHDETLRLVQGRQRAGLATPFDVERAQTDAESARAQIPAAGDDRGGLSPSHRGADRRPGLSWREHRAVARRRCRPRRPSPDSLPRCCSAGLTCWR
jgi:multidrug efflux system outer membrane protein